MNMSFHNKLVYPIKYHDLYCRMLLTNPNDTTKMSDKYMIVMLRGRGS